jgi:hypothetical protein
MHLFLITVSGLAWTIVYLDAIRIGVRHRTYAMPVAALGLNFAWESIYAVHDLTASVSVQGVINLIWAIGDVAIIGTFFRFGRGEFPAFVTRTMFVVGGMLVFAASYTVQGLFLVTFGAHDGAGYAAFLQNLLMSGLFIAMFLARRGLRGQTPTIAIAKWVGTLAPTILFGAVDSSMLLLGIGLWCSVFDLAYIGLVFWARTNPPALVAVPARIAAVPEPAT